MQSEEPIRVDVYLLSIIQAAEAQRAVPPLRLVLSSGDLVSGVPVRSIEFDVAMEFALAKELGGDRQRSEAALSVLDDTPDDADLLICIGTSLRVAPARNIPSMAQHGRPTVAIINRGRTSIAAPELVVDDDANTAVPMLARLVTG